MPTIKAATPNVYIVCAVLVCNFLIFAILRYLLDQTKSDGQLLIQGGYREIISAFLGLFIMTFFFCCCCCFCCGKKIICIDRLAQQKVEALQNAEKSAETLIAVTPNLLETVFVPKSAFLKPEVKHTLSSSSPNLRTVSPTTSPTKDASRESLIPGLDQIFVVPGE